MRRGAPIAIGPPGRALAATAALTVLVAAPPAAAAPKKERVREEVVVVDTTLGRVTFRLFAKEAPRTVEAFRERVRAGLYDGVLVHRVLPGLAIETGDLETREEGPPAPPVTPLAIEPSHLKHRPGTVSMAHARNDPYSRTEFFVCMQEIPYYNGRYTIIGEVIAGMKVVEAISNVPHNTKEAPLYPVRVRRAYLEEQEFVREVR